MSPSGGTGCLPIQPREFRARTRIPRTRPAARLLDQMRVSYPFSHVVGTVCRGGENRTGVLDSLIRSLTTEVDLLPSRITVVTKITGLPSTHNRLFGSAPFCPFEHGKADRNRNHNGGDVAPPDSTTTPAGRRRRGHGGLGCRSRGRCRRACPRWRRGRCRRGRRCRRVRSKRHRHRVSVSDAVA